MKNIITHPTIEEKKSKAIEVLKLLDIYKPYIDGFKQEDKVCFFEQFGGFWVTQEPEIEKKMHEIEQKHNCKVYAITHEFVRLKALNKLFRLNSAFVDCCVTVSRSSRRSQAPWRANVSRMQSIQRVWRELITATFRLKPRE